MATHDEKFLQPNDARTPAQIAEDGADEYLSSHRPTERAAMGQVSDALSQDRRNEMDDRADEYLSSHRPTERAAMGQVSDALSQDRRNEMDDRADEYLSGGRAWEDAAMRQLEDFMAKDRPLSPVEANVGHARSFGQKLTDAAAQQDVERAQHLIVENRGRFAESTLSWAAGSAMFYAAQHQDPAMAQTLVAAGADLKLRNHEGQTALHKVAHPDVAQLLVNAGADVVAKDHHHRTPIDVANKRGDFNVAAVLSNGPSHTTPEVNIIPARDMDSAHPLHAAAFDFSQPDGVNLPKLREALNQGANVNAHDEHGRTALGVTHSVEAAQMLIDAGAGFDPGLYYGDELWNERSPQFKELVGDHQKRMEQEDMDRVGERSGLNEHDVMTPLEELQQAHLTSGYQARQAHEQKAPQVEQKASEQAQAPHEHQEVFDTFKEQVTAPNQAQEQSPLEQAQQARSNSLGGAAKAKTPEASQNGEPDVSALKGARLSDMPRDAQKEPDVSAHKGARLMDLKIPERGGQEPSAGEAFNQETTRRVAARMPSTMGQATEAAGMVAKREPEQETEKGQGKSQGEGGHSKPTHESFFQAVSSGSIATPERDVQSAEKQQARRRVDRSRSAGF